MFISSQNIFFFNVHMFKFVFFFSNLHKQSNQYGGKDEYRIFLVIYPFWMFVVFNPINYEIDYYTI